MGVDQPLFEKIFQMGVDQTAFHKSCHLCDVSAGSEGRMDELLVLLERTLSSERRWGCAVPCDELYRYLFDSSGHAAATADMDALLRHLGQANAVVAAPPVNAVTTLIFVQ